MLHAPFLTEIEITRPDDFGAGSWRLANLKSITVLFGKNGSGKSRLLRAWRDKDTNTYHYIVPERVGDLNFQPGLLESQSAPSGRRDTSQTNSQANYRSLIVTRIQAYFMARGATRGPLTADGDATELEQYLARLLPDFELTLRGGNPPYQLVRLPAKTAVENVNDLSSGEAQILALGLDVLTIAAIWQMQHVAQRVLLIDEPDAHIHPDLLVRFSDFLVEVATKYRLQIVIATHSTSLLAAIGQFAKENAALVYLDRTSAKFRAEPFTKATKELAACLGGHALMGPLFGVPLLLVEGDDDYRLWSQVPRHHVVSFSVIPTNGDEIFAYQRSLERILGALREPSQLAGFALLDGDKPLPIANPQALQNQIRFVKLQCQESENLYLSVEVLKVLGLEPAAALAKIAAEAPKFGAKAAQLANAETWTREKVDIHEVIDEITAILDPKNVHWTIRVARVVGEKRPTGDLANFLGVPVVEALWGPVQASTDT